MSFEPTGATAAAGTRPAASRRACAPSPARAAPRPARRRRGGSRWRRVRCVRAGRARSAGRSSGGGQRLQPATLLFAQAIAKARAFCHAGHVDSAPGRRRQRRECGLRPARGRPARVRLTAGPSTNRRTRCGAAPASSIACWSSSRSRRPRHGRSTARSNGRFASTRASHEQRAIARRGVDVVLRVFVRNRPGAGRQDALPVYVDGLEDRPQRRRASSMSRLACSTSTRSAPCPAPA